MKITAEEFQKMLQVNDTSLLEHLVLNSSTDEVIKSYEREKALDIVLTINGFEVDIISFLKLFEDQYDKQTALSAKKLYGKRIEKILEPYYEAAEKFIQLSDHMDDEIKEALKDATDVSWLFDKEEPDDGD